LILPEETRFTAESAFVKTSERMMDSIHFIAGINKNDKIIVGCVADDLG
jgi:hypothetical protein